MTTVNNKAMKMSIAVVAVFIYGLAAISLYGSGIVSVRTLHMKNFFLFPMGVVVAAIAMSSGISGSNFWVPINIIVLHIEPRIGFWRALFSMLFGFGSGVVRHLEQKTIRPRLVGRCLAMAIPGAIFGTLIVPYVNTAVLLIALGVFVGLYGTRLLFVKNAFRGKHEKITLGIAFVGGMRKGMLATGLGKLLLPRLIDRQGLSHAEAVGTVVCIVFITNVVAVLSILCASAKAEETCVSGGSLRIAVWKSRLDPVPGLFGKLRFGSTLVRAKPFRILAHGTTKKPYLPCKAGTHAAHRQMHPKLDPHAEREIALHRLGHQFGNLPTA